MGRIEKEEFLCGNALGDLKETFNFEISPLELTFISFVDAKDGLVCH